MFDILLSILIEYSFLTSGKYHTYNNTPNIAITYLNRPTKYFRTDIEFYKLINYHRLNDKKRCLQCIDNLEFFDGIPERYKVVTYLIKTDVEMWKNEAEDLTDISREMRKSTDRLKEGNGGKTTQKIQKDIVARLDQIIKSAEDKKNQNEQNKENQGKQGNRSDSPLDESKIIQGDGTGQVNVKKFKNLMEKWGSLLPRAQAQALQELTAGMSSRHREAIENYFRNIANQKKR